jgi:hypothetical protein
MLPARQLGQAPVGTRADPIFEVLRRVRSTFGSHSGSSLDRVRSLPPRGFAMSRCPLLRAQAEASSPSASSTTSSWVWGETLGKTLAILPSGSTMKVARCAPQYFFPYIDFSTQVP